MSYSTRMLVSGRRRGGPAIARFAKAFLPLFAHWDRAHTDASAGKDATTVFYGLHRSEVLAKPQYQRLKIGQIEGQKQKIRPNLPGEISTVSDASDQSSK